MKRRMVRVHGHSGGTSGGYVIKLRGPKNRASRAASDEIAPVEIADEQETLFRARSELFKLFLRDEIR